MWRARDGRLNRVVAIKQLKGQHSGRFQQEAQAIAALNHANICQIYDVGPDYLVMEHVEGKPLAGPLPVEDARRLAVEIASAMEEAHGKGILHRDLKPANILVTAKGSAKLLDFGLAKLMNDAESDATQTLAGTVLGTAAYMAPEQAQGQALDERSDIFSFGAVLYEMLSGRRAFAGNSIAQVLSAVLRDEPAGFEGPADLQSIVRRCLAKDPAARFPSFHEVGLALRGVTSEQPVVARKAGGSKRWTMPAIAAAVVVLAGAGFLYSRGDATQTIDSLAVLPFVNAGGSADAEYLSDGIAESLMDTLSEFPNLKVMSRSAVLRYKGKEPDVPAVSRELGVRAVLTGRITQRGENLTVTAELVDAKDNSHLWGEQYNRKVVDALAVQREIAQQIVQKLRLRLSSTPVGRLTARQTENPEAYQLYLKGRYFAGQFTPEGLDKGMGYFRQAIALDPKYALAYDGLAYSYQLMEDLFAAPRDVMPKAQEAASKALELDDSVVDTHVEIAFNTALYDYDWAESEREFQKAIALNANYAPAHEYYSWLLIATGRIEQGVQEARRAVELDPLSMELQATVGWNLYFAHRYDEAAAQLRKCLELDANYPLGNYMLGQVYAQQGRLAEAMAAQRKAADSFGNAAWPHVEIARNLVLAGKVAEARKALADLQARSPKIHVPPYLIATVYAALGEKDRAFAQLEEAYTQRSFFLNFLKGDPELDGLRTDPRFTELLGRMKLL